MSEDTHPHGAHKTVSDELAANNHANQFLQVSNANSNIPRFLDFAWDS
jgi:hypothetical protein